jgi:DNA-binding transcriptional MerR regulator
MTIDELARNTGMTVRNIRAHQSRGLLPPPEVRARTGYYGPEHVARLELIKELQGDGFNLEAIRRLLEGAGESSSEVLRFTRAVRAPFEDEQPQIVTAEELASRWGEADPDLIRKAERLGLLSSLGDGRFQEIPRASPAHSSTSSSTRSGSRSRSRAAPRSAGPRSSRPSSASAPSPPRPSSASSS